MWLCKLAQKSLSSNSHVLSHQLCHYYRIRVPPASASTTILVQGKMSSKFFFSFLFSCLHSHPHLIRLRMPTRPRARMQPSKSFFSFFFFTLILVHMDRIHTQRIHTPTRPHARDCHPHSSVSVSFSFSFFLSVFTLICQPIRIRT